MGGFVFVCLFVVDDGEVFVYGGELGKLFGGKQAEKVRLSEEMGLYGQTFKLAGTDRASEDMLVNVSYLSRALHLFKW